MTPPDGHWHRRTPKPVKTVEADRWFGCQTDDCPWVVVVHHNRSETCHRDGYGVEQ